MLSTAPLGHEKTERQPSEPAELEPVNDEQAGGRRNYSWKVSTMNGEEIPAPPFADSSDGIRGLRAAIAASLGVSSRRVALLHEGVDLGDELTAADVSTQLAKKAADSGREDGVIFITAIKLPCGLRPSEYPRSILRATLGVDGQENPMGFLSLGRVDFPAPCGVDVNMMPFRIGDYTSLPPTCKRYWPLLQRCCGLAREFGRIGYLTIHESTVPSGTSQRRPGLHIETPGTLLLHGGGEALPLYWGGGDEATHHALHGGIYIASSVAASCAIWNARVLQPELAAGPLGDVEHLRELLGPQQTLDEGELVWLTDTTPHESLPLSGEAGCDVYRQFFRVVTSQVSAWYEKHSTANPLGIAPDPAITRIVREDKFAAEPFSCRAPA